LGRTVAGALDQISTRNDNYPHSRLTRIPPAVYPPPTTSEGDRYADHAQIEGVSCEIGGSVAMLSTVLNGFRRFPELLAARRKTSVAYELAARYVGGGHSFRYPFDVPLYDGGLLRVRSAGEVRVFWQIFVCECYRLWSDCRTIVDAGANIGMFSVWAAKQLPEARILALEPYPETFSNLQYNLRANHLDAQVKAIQVALSSQSGERTMLSDGESPRRRLVPADEITAEERVVRVPCISLADLAGRWELKQIDLLKMDIEGSEWEVLFLTPAAVLQLIRRIQFEYHEVHALSLIHI